MFSRIHFASQNHRQALAAALGVPDDAALTGYGALLGLLDSEVLVVPRRASCAGVEDDEVVDQLEEALLVAELKGVRVELVLDCPLGSFHSSQYFSRRLDRRRNAGLRCRYRRKRTGQCEKNGSMNSFFWLSRFWRMPSPTDTEERFNSIMPSGDAVDIEDNVGALVVLAENGDFLGNGEVVVERVLPVDQPDGLVLGSRLGQNLDPVAKGLIDLAVGVVEETRSANGGAFLEVVQSLSDPIRCDSLPQKPTGEELFLDVAIALALLPVAQVGVVERLLSERTRTTRFCVTRSFWPTELTPRPSRPQVSGESCPREAIECGRSAASRPYLP